MTLSVLGTLALALICAWVFGGIALRLAGGLLTVAGLLGLSLSGNANGLLVFGIGACLWLAGQIHFRLRHGGFKGMLTERVCLAATSARRRAPKVRQSARSR